MEEIPRWITIKRIGDRPKLELGRWEEAAYDAYVWLYTPREEAREFAGRGASRGRRARRASFRSRGSC